MVWLIGLMQGVSETPLCIDSPNAKLLARILEEGHVKKPGMVNSVNEEGTKCETIFPLIAGTDWNVIGLTCDQDGIPADPARKVEIAKRIIDKADHYGVKLANLHIDPCVMALATMPSSMEDFARCIESIHAYAPEVKVTGAISNISFDMPARKYVNMSCMAYAIAAGLDSAIILRSAQTTGQFSVSGLDDSTYSLREIKAPAAYNLLTQDVAVTLTATTANGQAWDDLVAANALTKLQVQVGDSPAAEGNISDGTVSITVENKKGTPLPETGGMGTTLFYVIGGLLVVGAGILLVVRFRMRASNKE